MPRPTLLALQTELDEVKAAHDHLKDELDLCNRQFKLLIQQHADKERQLQVVAAQAARAERRVVLLLDELEDLG